MELRLISVAKLGITAYRREMPVGSPLETVIEEMPDRGRRQRRHTSPPAVQGTNSVAAITASAGASIDGGPNRT